MNDVEQMCQLLLGLPASDWHVRVQKFVEDIEKLREQVSDSEDLDQVVSFKMPKRDWIVIGLVMSTGGAALKQFINKEYDDAKKKEEENV